MPPVWFVTSSKLYRQSNSYFSIRATWVPGPEYCITVHKVRACSSAASAENTALSCSTTELSFQLSLLTGLSVHRVCSVELYFFGGVFNGTTPLAASQNFSSETGAANLTQSVLIDGPELIFLTVPCQMEMDKERHDSSRFTLQTSTVYAHSQALTMVL